MLIRADALLCAVRAHGEHGAVIRVLTAAHGNTLALELRARGSSQLQTARAELVASRAPWLGEPLPAAGIGWTTALAAATLPEGHPYPAIHSALGAALDAICHAPSARGWARAIAGYEALLVRELGYGSAPFPPPDEAWPDLLARLDRQGTTIGARLLNGRNQHQVMAARALLMDRLHRIDRAD
jgi:DNA repair protein RecO (recombination protein O)